MKFFSWLSNVLATYLEMMALDLESAKRRNTLEGFYAECGKEIYETSRVYPANEMDAAIIFQEWCKGILSECCPDHKTLREYAEYTANPIRFCEWKLNKEQSGV